MTVDAELEEQFFPTNAARLHRWLPWLRLFRTFRIAIDYRRMFVALVAIWVWSAGLQVLMWLPLGLWGAPQFEAESLIRPFDVVSFPLIPQRVSIDDWFQSPFQSALQSISNTSAVLQPWSALAHTYWRGLMPETPWMHRFCSGCSWLWGLAVMGFFGGMISRMAAVEVTGDGEGSLRPALRYATRRFPATVIAPLLAFFGLVLFWMPNLFAGWIAKIPAIGPAVVGLFWFLPLTFGLCLALIGIGLTLGWPLMVASANADGSDAFDALSRAYSYLFNRPWYALFLAIVATVYGSILLYFVTGLLTFVCDLTVLSVESGLGSEQRRQLLQQLPQTPMFLTARWSALSEQGAPTSIGAIFIGYWMRLVASIPLAFVFSYFWTAVTTIYILLRRAEDATPLSEIDGGSHAVPHGPMPVVGMPAATLREHENEQHG